MFVSTWFKEANESSINPVKYTCLLSILAPLPPYHHLSLASLPRYSHNLCPSTTMRTCLRHSFLYRFPRKHTASAHCSLTTFAWTSRHLSLTHRAPWRSCYSIPTTTPLYTLFQKISTTIKCVWIDTNFLHACGISIHHPTSACNTLS